MRANKEVESNKELALKKMVRNGWRYHNEKALKNMVTFRLKMRANKEAESNKRLALKKRVRNGWRNKRLKITANKEAESIKCL